MARKPLAEQLTAYKKQLSASKQWRKNEQYDQIWKRLSDLYRGRHYDHYSEEDRMLVNVAFATINVLAPATTVNYPKITVTATKPEDAPQAVISEAVVNYWWRHRKVHPEIRKATKDMLIFGHGWVKVGYRFVEEEVVSESDNPADTAEGGESTPNTIILEDSPFAERVSPFDVFVDPDATSDKDMRWIAQRIRKPISEVKADKRYAKAAREAVGVMAVSRYSDDYSQRKIQDKNVGYAEIWEFYDVVKRTMCVFSEDGDQFLVKPIKMPYAFGQPFVMFRNYDVPDQFYPMGDLESIEPLQKELNETRTQMMNHRKRFARKYLYKESAFDQLGRSALESDEDNVMVPVISDESLANVITPMPAVINPADFYNQSNMIVSDIDRVSGVSEFQRGSVSEIRRTATEMALIQDASNARTADKLAIIELAIGEIGRRLLIMAQQFMTGEQVARLTAKNGESVWVKFDRDYLMGDFDFEVVGGSTQPVNESFRRQQALQIVDAMAPFASAGVVDMQKLAAYVLQSGFGIKNPEQFIMSPPPPPEQMAPAGALPPAGAPLPPDMPLGEGIMPPVVPAAESMAPNLPL